MRLALTTLFAVSTGCHAAAQVVPSLRAKLTHQSTSEESRINPEQEYDRGHNLVLGRNFEQAIKHFTSAIDHWGDRPGLHELYYERGVAYECIEEYDKAIDDLTVAIKINRSVYFLFSRGKAYCRKKDYHLALRDYLDAVKLRPNDYRSLNAAAWLLASSPVETDRNGAHALELALRACDVTRYQDIICIDTLACAYAETGNFEKAVEWETRARDLFVEQEEVHDGSAAIDFTLKLVEYENKIKLFRAGKPFR